MCDPDEFMAKFGWSLSPLRFGSDAILSGLLRAKALSALFEFPACPIGTSMAKWALRTTTGVKAVWSRQDMRWTFLSSDFFRSSLGELVVAKYSEMSHDISLKSRLVMERVWGVSVEKQLFLEKWFDENELQVLPEWFITNRREDWKFIYDTHVITCSLSVALKTV